MNCTILRNSYFKITPFTTFTYFSGQSINAPDPIEGEPSKITSDKDLQKAKQSFPIFSTLLGIRTALIPEKWKAYSPIPFSLESDSKTT
jgi:hypothetical protein